MKYSRIAFNDDYMHAGAKAYAKEQKISFSEYVTRLIASDLKNRHSYKIIGYYDNGTTDEENDFYTKNDLMESVRAYASLYYKGEPLCDKTKIIGYEVYEDGRQIQKVGVTEQPPEGLITHQ